MTRYHPEEILKSCYRLNWALQVSGHHTEQRSSNRSTRQSTSVPSLGHSYFTIHQTDGKDISMKLVLGTVLTLVSAIAHIDNLVDQLECGPNTVQPRSKYKLYLVIVITKNNVMWDILVVSVQENKLAYYRKDTVQFG